MKHEYEVKIYMVEYRCDKCMIGLMVPWVGKSQGPPSQFPHTCSGCGEKQLLDRQYPYQKNVRV